MTAKKSTLQSIQIALVCCLALAFSVSVRADDVLRATLTNGLQVIIVRNTLAPGRHDHGQLPRRLRRMPRRLSRHGARHRAHDVSRQPGLDRRPTGRRLRRDGRQRQRRHAAGRHPVFLHHARRKPGRGAAHRGRCACAILLADEKLWDKERGAIEQEVAQDLSNPEYVFYMQLLAAMFKGSPYEHDALGTRPSFDKTTDADLRKFHNTWYVPNNAILVIVGDVEPPAALEQVKKIFGGIPSAPLPARPDYNFSPVKPDTLKLDTDLPYGMTAVMFRFPGTDNPDFAAAQILSDVLSSQRGKLYELVPQGKALFSAICLRHAAAFRPGLCHRRLPRRRGLHQPARPRSNTILAAEITNGVNADLVEAAKRREIISAELQKNSVAGPGLRLVAGRCRRRPEFAGRRHRRHPPGHGGRREPRRQKIPGFRPRHQRHPHAAAFRQADFVQEFRRPGKFRLVQKCQRQAAVVGEKTDRQAAGAGFHAESVRHESARTASG